MYGDRKLCTDQFVISTPTPPRATPRAFDFWRSNFRPPVPKSCSNAPHVRPTGWANAPPLGHIFLPLTGQDRFKTICYKYQLAFFILKLDKGTSYLHSKASLSFYGPFLFSHSVTNATYCHFLLTRVWLSWRTVKFPTFRGLVSNSPPPHTHTHSGSKVKFPTLGKSEGVKCPWCARRGGAC